eukprot:scaffold3319_cov427-Prasinococcus_capsulatus_cf.AAC.15
MQYVAWASAVHLGARPGGADRFHPLRGDTDILAPAARPCSRGRLSHAFFRIPASGARRRRLMGRGHHHISMPNAIQVRARTRFTPGARVGGARVRDPAELVR